MNMVKKLSRPYFRLISHTNRYFSSRSVIVLIVLICFQLRGCLMSLVDMGECCFGKNRLVHRRFSVDFGPTFFNQLNGRSLLFELDLKSRRSLQKMASSNNIDIKEDVKEDVMEDGGRRVSLYRGRYSS